MRRSCRRSVRLLRLRGMQKGLAFSKSRMPTDHSSAALRAAASVGITRLSWSKWLIYVLENMVNMLYQLVRM